MIFILIIWTASVSIRSKSRYKKEHSEILCTMPTLQTDKISLIGNP